MLTTYITIYFIYILKSMATLRIYNQVKKMLILKRSNSVDHFQNEHFDLELL